MQSDHFSAKPGNVRIFQLPGDCRGKFLLGLGKLFCEEQNMCFPVLISRIFAKDRTQNDTKFVAVLGFS